jgi:hypothetical protein
MMTVSTPGNASRTRPPAPTRSTQSSRSSRPLGAYVLIGVPVLLGLLFVLQIASGFLKTEIIVRNAVAVSRVSLEPDPVGARVYMTFVDRLGADTTFSGELTVKVREPDGAVWQTVRSISGSDFVTLPPGSLLGGRQGYSIPIPQTDWARPPRRGGAATVSVDAVPSDGSAPFSSIDEERIP